MSYRGSDQNPGRPPPFLLPTGTIQFIVGQNTVVVLWSRACLVRATGRVVEANWAQIFTFRDGLICRFREYRDTALGSGSSEAGVGDSVNTSNIPTMFIASDLDLKSV